MSKSTIITVHYMWTDPFFGSEECFRSFESREALERFFAPMLDYVEVLDVETVIHYGV